MLKKITKRFKIKKESNAREECEQQQHIPLLIATLNEKNHLSQYENEIQDIIKVNLNLNYL